MTLNDLNNMSQQELKVKLKELQEEKFKLGFKHKINAIENPMQLKNMKKNIARIQTILKQKYSDK